MEPPKITPHPQSILADIADMCERLDRMHAMLVGFVFPTLMREAYPIPGITPAGDTQ